MIQLVWQVLGCGGLAFLVSCSFTPVRPCSTGGQAAHEDLLDPIGVKKCQQRIDPATGEAINDGKYLEWYENGTVAVEGEYKKGKKSGRWREYDTTGKKVSDRYFQDGKEIPKP